MAVSQVTLTSPPIAQRSSLFSQPATRISWRLWALWLVGFGIFSMMIPRDASFDVMHYHLHNGWAALAGRETYDLAPAEMHSFMNPVWQMFVWTLIETLPGRGVAFLLGALQGLILPALYALTRRVLNRAGADVSLVTVMAVSIAGFAAEAQFGLMGSVRNDAVFAGGLIAALALLLPDDTDLPNWRALATSSFLVGALVGLKLTNAVYVPIFAIAVLALTPTWKDRAKACLICAGAGLFAIALFGGYWAWLMAVNYGNPIFPNLNGFFQAPLGPDTPFRDTRYLPGSFVEGIMRPFLFLFDGERINEHDFFDPRFQFTYLCSFVLLGLAAQTRLQISGHARRTAAALGAGAVSGILAWTFLFSISRYMAAAWFLGPTFLVFTIALLRPKWLQGQRAAFAACFSALLFLLMTMPAELRRVSWQSWDERYIEANLPQGMDYSNSVIAFSGGYPAAFLAPFFPETARMTHLVPQDWSAPALENYRAQIRDLIRSTSELYVVISDTEGHIEETRARLETLEAVFFDPAMCETIETNMSTSAANWVICPARFLKDAS